MTDNDRRDPNFNQCLSMFSVKSAREVLTRKALSVTLALHSMTTTTKQDWIPALRDLAQRNYSKGYGWQVLVECWGNAEWLNLTTGCDTLGQAKNKARSVARIYQEQFDDANAEIL